MNILGRSLIWDLQLNPSAIAFLKTRFPLGKEVNPREYWSIAENTETPLRVALLPLRNIITSALESMKS